MRSRSEATHATPTGASAPVNDEISADDAIAANRALWDAWTRAHVNSAFYDVPGFLAGRDPLSWIETEELGDVAGKRFLHLQCHFGIDTLGWARRGAHVTGVDFSPEAIATARDLARRAGLEAMFVESDVYALGDLGLGTFDIVHSSYGVLSWLPDLDRWAAVIARHLTPGGLFHLVENHPFGMMLDDDGVSIRWPYLATGGPIRLNSEASYVGPIDRGPLPEYNWPHGIGEVVTALIGAGLRIVWLREYSRSPSRFPGFLEKRPDGDYGWPGGREDIPLTFSIGAVDPRGTPSVVEGESPDSFDPTHGSGSAPPG
jgi:SAM-dependent methyltransferase